MQCSLQQFTIISTLFVNYEKDLRDRFSLGDAAATIVNAPLNSPEPPIPATARPIIRAIDEGATPHMREPISKIARNVRKVIWMCLRVSQAILKRHHNAENFGLLYL
jgi:hypothetical protein